MKKKINLITTILLSAAALCVSSCLKDSRFVDFSKVGTLVEFPLGGVSNFAADAITEPTDTITRQFAVIVASPTVPKTATTVTLSINDPAVVTAYNASQSAVSYLPMPTNAFVFSTTTVTIPAGQRTVTLSVTFYRHALDPSLSYLLPIKIISGTGATVPVNLSTHYFHFIGNDFAGTYSWDFTRYNSNDTTTAKRPQSFTGHTTTISPVTPNQFEVQSGYFLGARYEVTFTKTGLGAAAMYSNFAVTLNSDDVTNQLGANGITVTTQPKFISAGFDPNASYTFAQAIKLFRFEYQVATSSGAARTDIDRYYKP